MAPVLAEVALRFHAMGTDVQAIAVVPPSAQAEAQDALARVERCFAEVEAALSRFLPDSELSRLNAAAGRPFPASPMLFTVLQAALDAAEATDGLFDPAVLGSLLAAGYDRTFDELRSQGPKGGYALPATHFSWRDIRLDAAYGTVTLPKGCGIDLGGIAKGWTADLAAQTLRHFPGYAVDAGGDIALGGVQADGAPWTVGVANPFQNDADVTTLTLPGGAVCTTTTAKRQWLVDGQRRHHLIDPRTGLPATSDVISATVAADTAAHAEVLAKVALLLGSKEGLRFLESHGAAQGVLVLQNGALRFTSSFLEAQCVA